MPRWLGLTSRAMNSRASGTTPSHQDRQIKLLFPDRHLRGLRLQPRPACLTQREQARWAVQVSRLLARDVPREDPIFATIVGCDEKGDEMHPLDDVREVSVNRGGVLSRVSSAGLIGNAMASANVRQAVAAPSGATAVVAAKTGTDVRSLTLSANG